MKLIKFLIWSCSWSIFWWAKLLILSSFCLPMLLGFLAFANTRVTIRPLFPGHVLFLDLQKCIRPGFLNRPKCPGFGCFLYPAPAEFLNIAACSRNMFRSCDFRVHSFKHSNIVYNFGASGSLSQYAEYLNLFWMSVCAVYFHFRFRDHTHSV